MVTFPFKLECIHFHGEGDVFLTFVNSVHSTEPCNKQLLIYLGALEYLII